MKKRCFDCVLLAVATLALPASVVRAQARLPIAYVSMQRIAAESSDAKVAAAKLETMRQEKTGQIAAKQRAVDAAHLALVQAGGIFQRSRRTALEGEENRQRAELQRLVAQAQTDVQNLQQQLQTDLRKRIKAVLDQLTKQRGVQIVLNADTAVVWASQGIDLTTDVVSLLNRSLNPPPARQ